MSNLQVRIPKSIFLGIFLSIGAMVVVGLGSYLLEQAIPSSPYARMNAFAKINNYNPAVYETPLHQQLAAQQGTFDSFVATPISLLCGGAVLGFFLRGLPWSRKRRLRAGVVAGALFSGAIVVVVFAAYLVVPRLLAALKVNTPMPSVGALTADIVLPLIAQFALGAVAYTLGSWLATLNAVSASASTPPAAATKPRKSGAL